MADIRHLAAQRCPADDLLSGERRQGQQSDRRRRARGGGAGVRRCGLLRLRSYECRSVLWWHVCCTGNAVTGGAFDQRKMEARADILVYTSEPLPEGIEASGPIDATLYLS